MAKGKSKKITIEDALVPVEEQPYEVPKNWCWVKLDPVTSICTGKKDANYGSEDGEYYFFTCASEPIRCDNYSFDTKAILLAGNGDIGNISIYNGKFEVYQRTYVVEAKKSIFTEYLYYYFKFRWVDYNIDKMYGTAIPYIRLGNLKDYEVPLPPLPEQQRIVEQIESLFSKLDEAKEKTQGVLDSFGERRAAILHKAFEGELSRNWREKNNIARDTWNKVLFDDSIEKMQNGIAKRSGCEGALFGVLRLANLDENDINTKDLREIKLTLKEQDNYKLYPGDVIMIRVNGSRENVGRQILIKEDANLAFCDHIIRIRFRKEILPEYMVLFSKTDTYRYYIDEHMVSSAGQNTISRKGLGELYITLPSYEEQKEIVNVANSIIEREIEICEKAEIVLNEIDLMKKSILAKAFRGELGTNDSSEESSIELLKQIIANE